MHYSVEVTKKFIIFVILAKLMSSHRASGFFANISRPIHCQGSTATIDFDFNLQGDSIVSGSKVWFFNQILIAEDIGSGFTALNNYKGRLAGHSKHGLTLSSVTTADSGTYEHEIFLAVGLTVKTATASLTVYIVPLAPLSSSGCSVNTSQSGNTVTCFINGNCGTPPLSPSWVNFTTTSNQFECRVKGTYHCCATSAALTSCYSGSPNDFCTTFDCASVIVPEEENGDIENEEIKTGNGATEQWEISDELKENAEIPASSTSSTTTLNSDATSKPDGSVFIILGICIIISYIIMVISIIDLILCYQTSTISIFMACVKTGHRCLCILYIVLVIVVVVCEIVIIIMILIGTGRECYLILKVGLVLELIIIAVTIIFVIVFIKTGVIIHNKDTMRNPRTSTDVKITASLHQMFISDLEWIGPKGNPLSTDGKYSIDQYNINTGETSLTITNVSQDDNGPYICQVKIGCKIAKDSIHILCDKEMKTKNSGPPAIHKRTQNEVEPKTTSKQTNERPQPLPPVGGVAEDKPKPRPQAPRPENIDQNLRWLSANSDNTQDLATGTPRPNKLTPLTPKQVTVQEGDASEEKTKKTRKKKKKKSQMNEEMEELKSQRTLPEDEADQD